jgi:hypothetical protein
MYEFLAYDSIWISEPTRPGLDSILSLQIEPVSEIGGEVFLCQPNPSTESVEDDCEIKDCSPGACHVRPVREESSF